MRFAAAAAVAALAVAVLAGCSAEPAKEGTPPAAPSAPGGAKAGDYPLTTCVVSDEPLGSMGDPVVFTHEGQEVRLCCGKCRKSFDADPAKYLAKIAAARKK
jgi:hypothetical protein